MNVRDSENIAADFVERGWELCDDAKSADAVVVNTCSVREQAEQKALGKLWHVVNDRKERGDGLPVICVTGCMAQNLGEQISKVVRGVDIILGARQTHKVAEECERLFKDISAKAGTRKRRALVNIDDDLQSHRLINKHIAAQTRPCAFVSIMQGCQMNCSYCIVPKTRGVQRSRPEGEILDEVARLAAGGTREVTLLGQVVNAFGKEAGGKNSADAFVSLLKKVAKIDGIERIRFTSPHPAFFTDALIDCYAELKELCPYVHLPMQSGSDRILKLMRRPYRSKQFSEIVGKLRRARPDISMSTDVIVGFPTESPDDFNMTKALFEECAFDMAYIFKYSPRAGTLSAQMQDDISDGEKEARNQILLESLRVQSQAFNDALIGTVQSVLAEAPARRGAGLLMGRTPHHRKAFFKAGADGIGKFFNVKIETATVSALGAHVV